MATVTPVYLSTASSSYPFVADLKEEHRLQLFLSPPHQAATNSLSGPASFFNTTHDQRESKLKGSRQHDDHEVDKVSISLGRSSDHKLFPSSSFHPMVNDDDSNFHKLFSSKTGDSTEGSGDSSVNWMPSRMRLMQKMTSSNRSETDHQPTKLMLKFHDQQYLNNEINPPSNSSNIRVCSDCNTTSTPLWRSGPRGPKSLCNACGIRQRKARRATAAAADGRAISNQTSSSPKSKVNSKVIRKLRTSHVAQGKKLSNKPLDSPLQNQKKLCFENLAISLSKNPAPRQVLPRDVEEAAILLMELSCDS
ncbi:GATA TRANSCRIPTION FACTOR 22-RELATED [Salix purpurea]|uniref:GATA TRANSCRIPTION FACTOR 22-RELATED n=1 Tax=Salix purpurea TaxID=77065 RepID=A0A9Q0ULY1_SALPP|nr:GATA TRANSCRIPTION FACTOR 22-RELATED [Salix purpurea]